MANTPEVNSITVLPIVVDVPDQPCQRLYGGSALRGIPDYALNFEGYQFWFASEKNRAMFASGPWKYAPAWGGFCSWGMSRELPPKWPWALHHLGPPASPWEGWFLHDEVLAFNIWEGFTTRFQRNEDKNWNDAVNRWKSFHNGTLRSGPFNTHCIGHGPLKNWCTQPQPAPWLEDLPNCVVTTKTSNSTCQSLVAAGNRPIDADCLADIDTVSGGGVVGTHKHFHEFPNDKKEFSIHLIILIVVGGVFALGLTLRLVQWRRKRKLLEVPQDEDGLYEKTQASCD